MILGPYGDALFSKRPIAPISQCHVPSGLSGNLKPYEALPGKSVNGRINGPILPESMKMEPTANIFDLLTPRYSCSQPLHRPLQRVYHAHATIDLTRGPVSASLCDPPTAAPPPPGTHTPIATQKRTRARFDQRLPVHSRAFVRAGMYAPAWGTFRGDSLLL